MNVSSQNILWYTFNAFSILAKPLSLSMAISSAVRGVTAKRTQISFFVHNFTDRRFILPVDVSNLSFFFSMKFEVSYSLEISVKFSPKFSKTFIQLLATALWCHCVGSLLASEECREELLFSKKILDQMRKFQISDTTCLRLLKNKQT